MNQIDNALEVLLDAALSQVTGGAALPTDKRRMVWRRQGVAPKHGGPVKVGNKRRR